jgi:hypothetical protein
MGSFRAITQGIRVRGSIENPSEATLRRWDESLLRSNRKSFKVWACGDICHGIPNFNTGLELWEMKILKSRDLKKFSNINLQGN